MDSISSILFVTYMYTIAAPLITWFFGRLYGVPYSLSQYITFYGYTMSSYLVAGVFHFIDVLQCSRSCVSFPEPLFASFSSV